MIPIIDDKLSESVEVFSVTVASLVGEPAVVVMPDTANVTITDNDGMYFQQHAHAPAIRGCAHSLLSLMTDRCPSDVLFSFLHLCGE